MVGVSDVFKQVFVIFLITSVLTGVVLGGLFYFSFDSLKTLLLVFLSVFGFVALASENLFFKSVFLIVLAFGLLLFFDDFSEYAFVVVIVLVFMFLSKFFNKLSEVFK